MKVRAVLVVAALSVGADILLRNLFPRTFGPSEAPQGAIASVGTIFYAGGFGVLSGYLTARLAGSRPVMHALALGGIVFLFALGGLVGLRNKIAHGDTVTVTYSRVQEYYLSIQEIVEFLTRRFS